MIVLIFMAAVTGNSPHWGVAVKTYDTPQACFDDLPAVRAHYEKRYPKSLVWCSEPIGYEED